mgnify:FL=1
MKKQNSAVTKKDLNSLEEQVKITKVEVRKLNTKLDGVRNKIWLDMENLKDEVKDEMALLRNDVAGMKDEIVTEVKAMREEFTAHQGAHERQQETLEDHEERIKKVEETTSPPSA